MGPKPVKSQVSIMAPGGEKRTQMNPFSQVSPTVLWIFLATLATICLVVLMTVSYLYAALVNKPLHPLEESMKKLGVTIAVGLRSPKIKHEDHSLFRKSQKSGTEWQSFGNGLYYVSQGKKTWYEAENFCMSREAHLTSVLSSEEQNYVTSQLTQPAWIGLTDGGQGKWEWTDGSRLVAQFWSQGQPGHSERLGDRDQDCTIIVPSSKGQNWNDVDCNQLNRWVCKGTLAMAPKKPPAPPPPPPPPEEEEIDLFQNPIKKVPVKYLWMVIFALTVVCLIILTITIKTYNALLVQDWTPYDEPMKKLRTTLSLGLRNRNVMYYQNPMKVSDIVEHIPQHLKDSEEVYLAEKKKYQALYKKGVRFGSDWRLFGWNFYYVSKANEKKTWHDAEYFCKSRDSHLVSILNEEEQKFISSKLNESAWIGLTDENVEGHWAWSDGSRLIIQYWADDNPNGSVSGGEADEDCVALKPSGSDLNWIDASCQELKRWVCKESIEFENTYSSSTMLTETGLNMKKNENDDF